MGRTEVGAYVEQDDFSEIRFLASNFLFCDRVDDVVAIAYQLQPVAGFDVLPQFEIEDQLVAFDGYDVAFALREQGFNLSRQLVHSRLVLGVGQRWQ